MNANLSSHATTTAAAATTATAETKTRIRKRWTDQDKAERLALFAQSGLNAAEFCRQLGISAATFSLWRRAARGTVPPPVESAPAFAQVCLTAPEPGVRPEAMVAPAVVMIHLPGGTKLAAPVGADPTWLAQLVKTLGA